MDGRTEKTGHRVAFNCLTKNLRIELKLLKGESLKKATALMMVLKVMRLSLLESEDPADADEDRVRLSRMLSRSLKDNFE